MSASSNRVAEDYMAPEDSARWQSTALIVGVVALVVSVAGGIANPTQFFRSYLIGFLFWLGIALGSLALLMLQYLTGGDWAMMIRRPLESATRTLPLMLLLFAPLAFGMRRVYVWAAPGAILPPHKAAYLTVPFFLERAAIYFAVWIALQWLLNRWSHQQDETGDVIFKLKLTYIAGPGLVLYGLTISFASVDWIMSLDPSWYSSIFGILIIGGQLVSAMALMIFTLVMLGREEPMEGVYQSRHYHDLGKLLFAFVMLWSYFSVSQLIIIWSGNLPEEISWYMSRHGGRMALGGIVPGDCALRAAVQPVALARSEAPAGAPGLDRRASSGGAPRGCLLAHRAGTLARRDSHSLVGRDDSRRHRGNLGFILRASVAAMAALADARPPAG
jgi:hypothetical protein